MADNKKKYLIYELIPAGNKLKSMDITLIEATDVDDSIGIVYVDNFKQKIKDNIDTYLNEAIKCTDQQKTQIKKIVIGMLDVI